MCFGIHLAIQKQTYYNFMKKILLLILVICFLSIHVFAQSSVWTLNDCIEFGLSHSNVLKKQQATIEIYKQNYTEAVGGFLPTVRGGVDGALYSGRVLDKDTYEYVNTNTIYNEFQLYSSLTLFDGFAQLAKVRMERSNKLKGLQQLQLQKDMLSYEIMELFFNVQYNQKLLKLVGSQQSESASNLKKAKKMEEVGLKSFPDIAEMEATAAQDSFLFVKQQNVLRQEIIKLKNKIDLPVENELLVVESDSTLSVEYSLETALDIYNRALNYAPQIKTAEQLVKAAEQNVNIARGALFPSLSLYGGYNTYFTRLMDGSSYSPYRDQLNNNQNYYVGLSLSVPVFTGLSKQSALRRSKQQLSVAKYEFNDTQRAFYSDIEQTVADVKGKSEEYVHAQKQTTAIRAAHEANIKKFDMGMISALELSTSANRMLKAQIEELNVYFQYQLKCKMLNYYKGDSFF